MSLHTLPVELIPTICDYLPNKDIKRVRLTCRSLSHHAPLRFSRVYISPSRANIDVLLAVARHPTFRRRVREIVWDDAQLLDYQTFDRFDREATLDHCFYRNNNHVHTRADPRSSALPVYTKRRDELWGAESALPMDAVSAHNHYSLRLLREQEAIVAAGEDVAALREGLRAFCNLTRVTVTAVAWAQRWLFPRYETPFFRSLPANFWMPLPRAWHGDVVDRHQRNWEMERASSGEGGPSPRDSPESISSLHRFDWEAHLARSWGIERRCFRGYTIVVEELLAYHAEHPSSSHSIRELVVDVNRSSNGIHHALFAGPHAASGPEHRDDHLRTLTLFSAFPLTRLDLAVNAHCRQALHGSNGIASPWHCFGPGLRRALEGLSTHLRHFSLSSTFVNTEDADASYLVEELPAQLDAWIPVERWPQLESFGLGRLVVDTEALVRLLAALPPATIRCVELDTLVFSSSTSDAMHRLRRHIVETAAQKEAWSRDAPRVVVMEDVVLSGVPPRAFSCQRPNARHIRMVEEMNRNARSLRLVVDEEVNEFLYCDPAIHGTEMDFPCPFGEKVGLGSVHPSCGRVVDDYDPEYCWPSKKKTVGPSR
ncbi:hypothetical protein DIS24_g8532 [Lasiodiplodia hormozganensis]|uniref:F-box domain-containing protein n=1 Tax=Lasiodiplodia hormozganensis TaxID=869390 RepID=A0AA40CPS2_9PEZI|nr:hypothetical protein DIS24_g8532 [Lasiodiplodia hormozganensis]